MQRAKGQGAMSEAIAQQSSYGEAQTLGCGGGWALWWRWVLATGVGHFAGLAVGAIVALAAFWAVLSRGGEFADIIDIAMVVRVVMRGVSVLAGLVGGAALGFAQWLVLRRYIQDVARRQWVLATAVGGFLELAILIAGSLLAGDSGLWWTLIVAGGALLGSIQWAVLRRYLQKAGWWVLANAVAWKVFMVAGLTLVLVGGGFLGLVALDLSRSVHLWMVLVVFVLGGVPLLMVPGAITGVALVWLLRTPISPSSEHTI